MARPVVYDRPFRYSLGYYKKSRRIIIGWFYSYDYAKQYLNLYSGAYPSVFFDVISSLF